MQAGQVVGRLLRDGGGGMGVAGQLVTSAEVKRAQAKEPKIRA